MLGRETCGPEPGTPSAATAERTLMEVKPDKLRFFRNPADFRRWLAARYDSEQELWVGFYRKDSGKGGLTYSEALDEALCYGWIDGTRKKLDDVSFTNRFTPRKARSVWSNVNIARVAQLTKAGRMAPAGIAAFEIRDPARSGIYSFEREAAAFPPEIQKILANNRKAKAFFDAQPPYYRKLATFFVMNAKRDETRAKRLALLIERSELGLRLPQFVPAASGRIAKKKT